MKVAMKVELPLEQMSVAEKLEALWADLSRQALSFMRNARGKRSENLPRRFP